MPNIEPNFIAILAATVACFFFSYIWYTPLFGKVWMREMGFDPNEEMSTNKLIRSMVLAVFGTFLTVFVFSNNMQVWTPSTWGITGQDLPFMQQVLSAALFTWLGFFVPHYLTGVAWQNHSWKVFIINAAHGLLMLLIAAAILMAF